MPQLAPISWWTLYLIFWLTLTIVTVIIWWTNKTNITMPNSKSISMNVINTSSEDLKTSPKKPWKW